MNFAIGIDLGTSTSQICVYRNGGTEVIPDPLTKSPIIPSVVAVNLSGELVVGQAAEEYLNNSGRGVREVKRKMGTAERVAIGDEQYSPEQVSFVILKYLKTIAEGYLGQPIRDVVISVPANFPDPARHATLTAGELAGLNVVRLINEPTAAALAFGVKNAEAAEQLVVFDFGGGTLDITTLEMMEGVLDVQASFGDTQLGGKDFDQAMVALVLRKFAAEHPKAAISEKARVKLKGRADAAKKALSNQRSTQVTMDGFATGPDGPIDLELLVTRDEYEREVTPLLDRARACVRTALTAGQLKPSAIDRVLLVGGTTYMPCVRQLVAELFNKEPKVDPNVHPDTAVATGAAVYAALAGKIGPKDIVVADGSPFGIGVPILSSGTDNLEYSELMAPNTKVPFSVKKRYKLVHENQTAVNIRVYQDHSTRTKRLDDKTETDVKTEITDIPRSVDGTPHDLEMNFAYDINGVITLDALIPATGQKATLKFDKSLTRPTVEDKAAAQQQVDALWTKSPLAARYEGLIARANTAVAASPADRAKVQTAVAALQEALGRNDEAATKATSDALTDLLFDLQDAA